jgi:dihydroorotate dehydrogenase
VGRRDGQEDGQGSGWYGAVGRPAFFALPPEASHRLATALLGLPLPWERVGRAVRDPSLEVDLCGVRLPNPIGLAAGFDKSCRHLDALGRLGFGFVVGGTITRAPRKGNPKPRIVRSRRRGAIVNSMGLPNPGAEEAAANLARGSRTAPRFASVADEDLEAAAAAVELLAPHVDGFELNASSPNAPWRHDAAHMGTLLTAFRERTEVPVLLKMPPFRSAEERATVLDLARAAVDAGAQGLVCSNTVPVEEPRLATGRGGLSGAPLRGLTPQIVSDVAAATGRSVPIVACGGIFTTEDVRACLEAGATAVQLYTGLIYRGPGIVGVLTRGLREPRRAAGT